MTDAGHSTHADIPQMDVAIHSSDMLSKPLKWVGKPSNQETARPTQGRPTHMTPTLHIE